MKMLVHAAAVTLLGGASVLTNADPSGSLFASSSDSFFHSVRVGSSGYSSSSSSSSSGGTWSSGGWSGGGK